MFTFGQCLLARDAKTKIPMWLNERQTKWHIDFERSETIQFSTCDYGAGMLHQGRFYYQKDMLSPSSDAILLKSADFIAWAEQIFQTSKKLLWYSRDLEAYIGQEADTWRREGGKLITGFRPGNIPIYPNTHD
jgi:hypothetical protein